MINRHLPLVLAGTALLASTAAVLAAGKTASTQDIERGRYLIQIAGCNDCHTPGYIENGGTTPEAQWLTGTPLGWQGPWGTTYATNLRLSIPAMTEEQWVGYARTFRPRPPMPWFNVAAMTDGDLRAIYRYVTHLGRAGSPAPDYLPPDVPATGPVVRFPAPPPAAGAGAAGGAH